MEKELITSYRFKKYLTSQPFFVWHSLKDKEEPIDEDNFEIDFWSKQIPEEVTQNVGAVVARTFQKIDVFLREELKSQNQIIITTGNQEEKIKQTKEAIDSGKIIIDPVFFYNGAVAKPFAFDTKNKIIINLKYAKKTKRIDIVNGYYDYSIISKNTKVLDYNLYLPKVKIYKVGEIDLAKTNYVHGSMSGDVPGATNSKGTRKDKSFMSFLSTRIVATKKNGEDTILPAIDDALQGIEKARSVDTYSKDKISMDVRNFGSNSEWDLLLDKINSPYAGINGRVVTKKEIVNDTVKPDSNLILSTLEEIDGAKVFTKNIKEYEAIRNANKVVWYDFEGYSLPIAPLDGVNPYQQLVFQVSVIVTEKNVEVYRENFVVDPATICLNDLFNIIEKVYQDGADAYVVYNRGYEIPRMNEMVALMFDYKHSKSQIASKMVETIDSNTVDLMNVFKISTKKALPPIMMNDQHAKASIKNVEKHITSNHIELPRPITPYKDLDVQNGGMAMNEAILRALGITGDTEWKTKTTQLQKYCENDVKAMIMVYDFIAKLKDEL